MSPFRYRTSHRCSLYPPPHPRSIQTTHIILCARRHSITKEMCAVKEAAVSHLKGLMDSMIRSVILRLPVAETRHHSPNHFRTFNPPVSISSRSLLTRALLTRIDFWQKKKKETKELDERKCVTYSWLNLA